MNKNHDIIIFVYKKNIGGRKMKKLLILVLAVVMVFSLFTACKQDTTDDTPETPAEEPADTPEEPADTPEEPADTPEEPADTEEGAEIAMITDAGEIDDKSFNQGTWEGIKEYAEANGVSYKYYKPLAVSDDEYLAAIGLAIEGGAKVVVTPGFLFATAIFNAQDMYPDTNFIILDADPNDGDWSAGMPNARIEDNVYSIYYAEHQSGFLAGYAAVKDGFTKLGFMGGMAVPAVMNFGYGFAQGAEYAAKEMGIDSIELKYHYTGNFDATPENKAMAASWYGAGTEVIFAAGGKVGNSVMNAAEAAGAKVIGVDVDQSPQSETVITSAKKELAVSVQQGLADFYAGSFKGGVIDTLDITVGAVGLPQDLSRFSSFTQADYDAIVKALVDDQDGVRTNILNFTAAEKPDGLGLEIVNITFVE